MKVEKIEVAHYSDMLDAIPAPTILAIAEASPRDGRELLLQIDAPIAFAMTDRLFGGSGRPFALDSLGKSWKLDSASSFRLVALEADPAYLPYKNSAPTQVVVTLGVKVGETNGKIRLLYPPRFAK